MIVADVAAEELAGLEADLRALPEGTPGRTRLLHLLETSRPRLREMMARALAFALNSPPAPAPAAPRPRDRHPIPGWQQKELAEREQRLAALRALGRRVRVYLVGCGASKQKSAAPARDLYTSDLFHKSLALAEQRADRVYIVSAQHGLLTLDQVIEPYERHLKDLSVSQKEAWRDQVLGALRFELGDLPVELTILAGADYAVWLRPRSDWGWTFHQPLLGLGLGARKKWLAEQLAAGAAAAPRLACNKEAPSGGRNGPRRCTRAPGHGGKHLYKEHPEVNGRWTLPPPTATTAMKEPTRSARSEAPAPTGSSSTPLPTPPLRPTAPGGLAYLLDLEEVVVVTLPGSSERRRQDLAAVLVEAAKEVRADARGVKVEAVNPPQRLEHSERGLFWQGALRLPGRVKSLAEITGPRHWAAEALVQRGYDPVKWSAGQTTSTFDEGTLYLPASPASPYRIGDRVVGDNGRRGTVIALCRPDDLGWRGEKGAHVCRVRFDLTSRQRSQRRHTDDIPAAQLQPQPDPPPRAEVLETLFRQGELPPRSRQVIEEELRTLGLLPPVQPPLHEEPGAAAVPPAITTPHTRLAWDDLAGWVRAWYTIRHRKISAERYEQEGAHLQALVDHGHLIEQETEANVLLDALGILKTERPAKGLRKDSDPTTVLIVRVNNRLARLGPPPPLPATPPVSVTPEDSRGRPFVRRTPPPGSPGRQALEQAEAVAETEVRRAAVWKPALPWPENRDAQAQRLAAAQAALAAARQPLQAAKLEDQAEEFLGKVRTPDVERVRAEFADFFAHHAGPETAVLDGLVHHHLRAGPFRRQDVPHVFKLPPFRPWFTAKEVHELLGSDGAVIGELLDRLDRRGRPEPAEAPPEIEPRHVRGAARYNERQRAAAPLLATAGLVQQITPAERQASIEAMTERQAAALAQTRAQHEQQAEQLRGQVAALVPPEEMGLLDAGRQALPADPTYAADYWRSKLQEVTDEAAGTRPRVKEGTARGLQVALEGTPTPRLLLRNIGSRWVLQGLKTSTWPAESRRPDLLRTWAAERGIEVIEEGAAPAPPPPVVQQEQPAPTPPPAPSPHPNCPPSQEECTIGLLGGACGIPAILFLPGATGPERVPARYCLTEAHRLIPSHDPLKGFQMRPDYPQETQERLYDVEKDEQLKVRRNAEHFEPTLIFLPSADGTLGPPIVTPAGVVLGGNGRTMSAQLHYAQGGTIAKEYLLHNAGLFGFTAQDVARLAQPIVVRVVKVDDDPKTLVRLVRMLNIGQGQALAARAEAVSESRRMDPEVLHVLSANLGEDMTLSDVLASRQSVPLIQALRRSEILTDRNQKRYLIEGTGLLNDEGRLLVERLLSATLIPDARLLEEVGPGLRGVLARGAPYLLGAAAFGAEWDLRPAFRAAARDWVRLRAQNAHGVAEYLRQGALLQEAAPAVTGVPLGQQVLEVIFALSNRPVVFARFATAFARLAGQNPSGQEALFATEKLSPAEALARAAAQAGVTLEATALPGMS